MNPQPDTRKRAEARSSEWRALRSLLQQALDISLGIHPEVGIHSEVVGLGMNPQPDTRKRASARSSERRALRSLLQQA